MSPVKLRGRTLLLLALLAPALLACGQLGQRPQLRVVATLAPFADWARQIGQERVVVTQLVPTGVDPRDWQPSEAELRQLGQADVVLFNGLGLEPWLDGALERSGASDFVALEIGQVPEYGAPPLTQQQRTPRVLPPLPEEDAPVRSLPSSVRAPTANSPFVWLDPGPSSAQRAVTLIAGTFAWADIDYLQLYRRNAEAYNGQLENLDTWIHRQVRELPRIDTGKEDVVAMQSIDTIWERFAKRYDITLRTPARLKVITPPLPNSTPLFVDQLSAPAAMSSATRPPDGVLRALGDDNYVRMMRANMESIARGMRAALPNASGTMNDE